VTRKEVRIDDPQVERLGRVLGADANESDALLGETRRRIERTPPTKGRDIREIDTGDGSSRGLPLRAVGEQDRGLGVGRASEQETVHRSAQRQIACAMAHAIWADPVG
jgi:hypothetical protein